MRTLSFKWNQIFVVSQDERFTSRLVSELSRSGFSRVISFQDCATASGFFDGAEGRRGHHKAAVFLDPDLRGAKGFLKWLMSDADLSEHRVFLIADLEKRERLIDFMMAGAVGYLDRETEASQLSGSLRRLSKLAS
jgi:DNA-binding NarL/FixJ family response regulator